jgi:glutathione S-transferase
LIWNEFCKFIAMRLPSRHANSDDQICYDAFVNDFRMPAMITVHHLNNSRSQRILWLLEELGLDYSIKQYERDESTKRAPASLKKIHPLGKSPVITDGENTIAESGAIVEYLIDAYGKSELAPRDGTPERLKYSYWLHFAEGSAITPLLMKMVFRTIATTPMPFFAKPIAKAIAEKTQSSFIDPQIKEHLDFIEAELTHSLWFAGRRFSGADIQMSFPLEAAEASGLLDQSYPKTLGFLARIRSRAAYQKAIKSGGEYSLSM